VSLNKQDKSSTDAHFLTNQKIRTEKENSAHFGTRFVLKGVPCVADRLVASHLQLAQLLYVTWDYPWGRGYGNATLLMINPFLLWAHAFSAFHRTWCWMDTAIFPRRYSGSNVKSTAYPHAELENAWNFMSTESLSWYVSMQYVTCRDIRERTQRGLSAAGLGTKLGLHGFSTNLGPPRNFRGHKCDIKQVRHWGLADIKRHRTKFNRYTNLVFVYRMVLRRSSRNRCTAWRKRFQF